MNPIEFTPELLVGIVGTVLSLVFSYFPVVHDWYQALKTEAKSGIMLGLLVISSTLFLIGNILSDLCVAAIDPRVRFE